MRSALVSLSSLDLSSLEITSGAHGINHLIFLFTICAPSKALLITAIGSHRLEIGTEELFIFFVL